MVAKEGEGRRLQVGAISTPRDPVAMTATSATVARFVLDLAREEQNGRALREFIIPGVRQHAGFVSAAGCSTGTLGRASSS